VEGSILMQFQYVHVFQVYCILWSWWHNVMANRCFLTWVTFRCSRKSYRASSLWW